MRDVDIPRVLQIGSQQQAFLAAGSLSSCYRPGMSRQGARCANLTRRKALGKTGFQGCVDELMW